MSVSAPEPVHEPGTGRLSGTEGVTSGASGGREELHVDAKPLLLRRCPSPPPPSVRSIAPASAPAF
jgi:hypothetical protein